MDGGAQPPSEQTDLWGEDHVTRETRDGVATFENLRTGLYLFTQSGDQASPGYYPVEPFLVSVPVYDSEYNYNVQAFPNDHEVKIYVKFRLMAIAPDPPDPPGPPDPPDPDPDPDPPAPDPDPGQTSEPVIMQWAFENLSDPLYVGKEEPKQRLPQTGQINWPVPLLMVSGAALSLLGLILRQQGKKERCEERKE